jgi:tRNA (adenine57-N1/adenine58-N1)-methyltransferase
VTPFAAGDLCLLVDARGRHYLVTLSAGGSFQYHAGTLGHDAIVGAEPGAVLRSSKGSRLVALRPRLVDYVLEMPRGAQVVYPKDLGAIVSWADVAPGMTVAEAGTGSGALTMTLLRAVGPSGRVVSVERRSDHLAHARKVIGGFLGELPGNLELVEGEIEEALAGRAVDRVILDLPEPWTVVGPAIDALAPGGILAAYLPTVPQVMRLHDELRRSRRFSGVETIELLIRDWRLDGRSVRPASQMVGHTGFLTFARLTGIDPAPDADDPAGEAGPSDD